MPTAQQYELLAQLDDELPSLPTVRNRLGRWSDVTARLRGLDVGDILRSVGIGSAAPAVERNQAIWLAHIAGQLSKSYVALLLHEGAFDWDDSYGPMPEAIAAAQPTADP